MLQKITRKLLRPFQEGITDDLRFSIGQAHLRRMQFHYDQVQSLHEVDFKIFSQFGEDGILDYLVQSLNIAKPKFLEIGVGDYTESNTRFLFQDNTSFGVIIDIIPDFEQKVYQTIGSFRYMGELLPIQRLVSKDNINEIYNQALKYGELDVFSLDVDGVDYWLLDALPENFAKIAIVEFNPYLGSRLKVTVPYDATFDRFNYHHSGLAFGASLRAMVDLMSGKGLAFVGTNKNNHNAFFVRKDLVSMLSISLPQTENLDVFCKNYMRESRDVNFQLSYLSGNDRLQAIAAIKFVDLAEEQPRLLPLKACKTS